MVPAVPHIFTLPVQTGPSAPQDGTACRTAAVDIISFIYITAASLAVKPLTTDCIVSYMVPPAVALADVWSPSGEDVLQE